MLLCFTIAMLLLPKSETELAFVYAILSVVVLIYITDTTVIRGPIYKYLTIYHKIILSLLYD